MKKILLLTAILALTTTVRLAAADGKELYTQQCAKCHGADGKGASAMGKKLGCKDYSDAKVQDALKDDAAIKAVKEGVKDKDGKEVMKATEGVSDADAKALVAYLRTLKK